MDGLKLTPEDRRDTPDSEGMMKKFLETKRYLYRVKDARRRVQILERRIEYHRAAIETYADDGSRFAGRIAHDIERIQEELGEAERKLVQATMDVTDLVGQLPDVNQQMVIIRRYVDMQTWEDISAGMGMGVRRVQKLHGRALPVLEGILKESGRIDDRQ